MAFDRARDVTVLFGGGLTSGRSNETWEWNGANWVDKTTTGPAARFAHAMVYDSTRNVTLLYGGFTGSFPKDTWTWDGANWTQLSPATTPSPVEYHAMAFDSRRGVAVLFGGAVVGAGFIDETWEWDGSNWSQKFPSHFPSARGESAMAYDEGRHVTVLFGGLTNAGPGSDETWEWDGSDWTQRFPASAPSPRSDHAMAYDTLRHVTVLFGGWDNDHGGNVVGETWEWDGANWTKRSPTPEPSPRAMYGAAFDMTRGATVLFGGDTDVGNSSETWEWTSPLPAITQQPTPQTVGLGGAVTFTITASGPGPASFQWRRNTTPLNDGAHVVGSTTASLTLDPVSATDSADYSCLVSNACGSTLSQPASLVVDVCKAISATGDCDGNGILDSCDSAGNAALDADANGVLDSCESLPAAQQASPCGLCGGGGATGMPLALLSMGVLKRRPVGRPRRRHSEPRANRD